MESNPRSETSRINGAKSRSQPSPEKACEVIPQPLRARRKPCSVKIVETTKEFPAIVRVFIPIYQPINQVERDMSQERRPRSGGRPQTRSQRKITKLQKEPTNCALSPSNCAKTTPNGAGQKAPTVRRSVSRPQPPHKNPSHARARKQALPLPHIIGAGDAVPQHPVWSADGQALHYSVGRQLRSAPGEAALPKRDRRDTQAPGTGAGRASQDSGLGPLLC